MPLLFTALYFRAHYLLLHQVDLKVMSKLEIDEHTRVRIVICSVVRVSLTAHVRVFVESLFRNMCLLLYLKVIPTFCKFDSNLKINCKIFFAQRKTFHN